MDLQTFIEQNVGMRLSNINGYCSFEDTILHTRPVSCDIVEITTCLPWGEWFLLRCDVSKLDVVDGENVAFYKWLVSQFIPSFKETVKKQQE